MKMIRSVNLSHNLTRIVCALFVILSAVAVNARAEAGSEIVTEINRYETRDIESAVPGSAEELVFSSRIEDYTNAEKAFSELLNRIAYKKGGIISEALKSTAMLVAAAVLTGFASSLFEESSAEALKAYIPLAGILTVAVISLKDTGAFIGLGRNTIYDMEIFSKALLPTLSAAAAAGGAVTSAAAKCAAVMLFIDIIITIAKNVLLPLIYLYIAACIGKAAFGGNALSAAEKLIKWLTLSILTALMLAFVIFLTVSGTLAATADAAAVKVAKTTISTALPVVGGIISDAAGTVLTGAQMIRNAFGLFGITIITATCLIPFLRLGIHYLCYKAASAVSAIASEPRTSELINGISGVYSMLVGMVGAFSVMIYISILSLLKAVGGV